MAELRTAARLAWAPSLSTVTGLLASAAFGLLIGGLFAALLAIRFFGYSVVTVQSGSMEPTLSRGDVIVARPVGIDDVHVGQVILFEQGRDVHFIAAHRVVGFINVRTNINNSTTGEVSTQESRLLRTRGDANATEDAEPVDAARLRGRLWFTVPGVGLILDHVPLQTVLIGVAGLAAAAWAVFELRQRLKRRRPRRDSPAP
jgi:signal peptidase